MTKAAEITNAEETTTIDETGLATQLRPTVRAEAAPPGRPLPLRVKTRIRAGGGHGDEEQPGHEMPSWAP